MRRLSLFLIALALASFVAPAHAQRGQADLSDAEVEQVRDSAYIANDRVTVFIKLIDVRVKALEDLYARPRRPGREQDTHDLFEQLAALADELNDNLDDYGPRHRDLRKSLPKLVEATERWATVSRTPPENTIYSLSRRIALESIQDLNDAAKQLIDEQKAWFATHPVEKEDKYTEESQPH
ncbi:MAG: hypothetical protein PW789_06855 [Edaphobacter sp.]|uniref:hypothetical protein n=1 Tax=Edaphobacter sp. TaxID=1934404 RepID=UPI0023998165|nr:hypothetical protein [Edaphobacter sp.]MDE1176313.1 hypothetical protein [Edaphobacter sp.]